MVNLREALQDEDEKTIPEDKKYIVVVQLKQYSRGNDFMINDVGYNVEAANEQNAIFIAGAHFGDPDQTDAEILKVLSVEEIY